MGGGGEGCRLGAPIMVQAAKCKRAARFASAVIALTTFAGPATAQTYPNRPITLMVSTTAGASPDLIARLFAQQLSDGLKTPVVVENKGGANGQIALQAIANAPPDGYTFLATTGATLSVNPALYPKTAQLIMTRLAPVTRFAHQDFMITARPSLNVRTLPELIEWSRKNPGKLNVSTTALGSIAYLTAQLFKQAAGIEFVTIPHNGGGLAVGAVLGEHADVLVETVSLSRPHIEFWQARSDCRDRTETQRFSAQCADPDGAESRRPDQRLDRHGGAERYPGGHHRARAARACQGVAELRPQAEAR